MREFMHKWLSANRRVWVAAAVCLLLAGAAFPFDHAVTDRVREITGGHAPVPVYLVTNLGNSMTWAVVFVALLVLYREERTGLQGLMGVFAAGLVTDIVKGIFDRTRPDGGPYSFPSGHTTCAFAAAIVLARRWPRLRYVFYLGAAGVGASRVVCLRHFPSDVLAGAAVGTVFGLAAAVLAQEWPLLEDRRAMLRVKVVLSVLLIISLFVVRHRPEPLATLAAPALLLVAVRRAGILLRPGLEP
jgi:undecaprenyl-diphosphatase